MSLGNKVYLLVLIKTGLIVVHNVMIYFIAVEIQPSVFERVNLCTDGITERFVFTAFVICALCWVQKKVSSFNLM